MQFPLRIGKDSAESLQLQIFEQIRRLIMDGRLRPGVRMPASRTLASDLRVSRNTVVLAYERLVAEGYLAMHKPVGAFVSDKAPHETPLQLRGLVSAESGARAVPGRPPIVFNGQPQTVISPYERPVAYDFWVGRCDARLFPVRKWRGLTNKWMRQAGRSLSGYGDPAGLWSLRCAIADHVTVARGIATEAPQILIVSGIQEGLNIVARLFVERDTRVAIENPCYQGAALLFASFGARLVAVPVDADGVIVERLPTEATLIYVTPSHQYPTGSTLSLARRVALLEWAERSGAYVLEDDYDGDFYYDAVPLPALKSLDSRDQVIYLGTFSKCLGASLRLGYMVLPKHLIQPATNVKALLSNCSPWLEQAVLAEFIDSGELAHHLRRLRTACGNRRDSLLMALRTHLATVRVLGSESGMHVACELPADLPLAFDIERRARSRGVGAYSIKTGNALVVGRSSDAKFNRLLLLGYASMNEREIEEGIARLALAIYQ